MIHPLIILNKWLEPTYTFSSRAINNITSVPCGVFFHDPLFRDLYWLPVVARIIFKMMVLAYKASNGTAPAKCWSDHTAQLQHSTPSAGHLVLPSLTASKGRSSKSRLFSVLAPRWWNKLPADVRAAESLSSFRKILKTRLFRVHLTLHSPLSPNTPPYAIIVCCPSWHLM